MQTVEVAFAFGIAPEGNESLRQQIIQQIRYRTVNARIIIGDSFRRADNKRAVVIVDERRDCGMKPKLGCVFVELIPEYGFGCLGSERRV